MTFFTAVLKERVDGNELRIKHTRPLPFLVSGRVIRVWLNCLVSIISSYVTMVSKRREVPDWLLNQ